MNIPIFESPWLYRGGCISGDGQPSDVVQQSRVHFLIDHESNSWNHNVINYYFDVGTVQEILKTPLFHQVEEDQLIWKAEKNGHYSVKSAYRLCMEVIADNSFLHCPGSWSNIWRLKVPPKVKNLVWRICRGCLPTPARLLDKGVNCSSMCAVCEESYEDASHVLYDCPKARGVWQNNSMLDKVNLAMRNNITVAEITFALTQEMSNEKAGQATMLLWSKSWAGYNVIVEHLEKSELARMAKCYRISSGYQYESKASAVRLE